MNYLSKTLSFTLLMVSGILYSGACDDYPYSHGDVDILVNTEDEIKILASAEEEVLFNDLDLRIEAQEMAEAAAKVRIIRFLEEEIGESCQSNKTQSSTVKFSSDDPENKEVDVEPQVDNNSFGVIVRFDVVGQAFPPQEFAFLLETTR